MDILVVQALPLRFGPYVDTVPEKTLVGFSRVPLQGIYGYSTPIKRHQAEELQGAGQRHVDAVIVSFAYRQFDWKIL